MTRMTITPKKKILIVSLSTGSGHVQAGKALEKTARLYFPTLECRHIDMADHITSLFKRATVDGYELVASKLPFIWKSIFKLTDNHAITVAYRKLTDQLGLMNSFDFIETVRSFNPDHIICTHFVPSEILVQSMKKAGYTIPITEIITDYAIHQMWVVDGIAKYIVSTEEMKSELHTKFKIEPSRVEVIGIPIDPSFYETKDTEKIRKNYDIPVDLPTIVVLSGGKGTIEISKVIENIFEHITEPTAVLAVAGNNPELLKKIKELSPPPTIIYRPLGWTDRISDLMDIADVVVTKPGGLTTTECTVSNVPVIAINPIPGQEEHNVVFLEKKHLGSLARTHTDVISLLKGYLSNLPRTKNRIYMRSGEKILERIAAE